MTVDEPEIAAAVAGLLRHHSKLVEGAVHWLGAPRAFSYYLPFAYCINLHIVSI